LAFWRRTVEKSPATAPNGQPVSYEWHGSLAAEVGSMSPEELYRAQPQLRTVITFLARNIAQLGLHTFDRVNDTDRERVKDGLVPDLLRRPNEQMTGYEFITAIVSNWALHDEVFIWHRRGSHRDRLFEIPKSWATYL